jgi:diacylglycerol kinase (ATP)
VNETDATAPPSLTFTGRLRSIAHAVRGIRVMIASQHNAWIHAAATLAVAAAGLWFRLSLAEWCWIAGKAKDVAAGAVLLTAIGAAIIGALVFGPHVVP